MNPLQTPRRLPKRRTDSLRARHIVIVLAGMGMAVRVNAVGELYLGELVLLAALIFALSSGFRSVPRWIKLCLLLFVLWFVGQVITDVAMGTPASDYLRGWAKIGFSCVALLSLYGLVRTRFDVRLTAYSLSFGLIFNALLYGPTDAQADIWKFGIGLPAALLVANLAGGARMAHHSVAILALGAACQMLLGFRSMAGIMALSAVVVAASNQLSATANQRRKTVQRIAVLASITAGAILFLGLYGVMAEQGYLGAEAEAKYRMQERGVVGLFVSGRSEFYASTQAIMDSPIIGHGSWAKDTKYSYLLLDLVSRGYSVDVRYLQTGLIPAHSYLLGSWVEAGIAAVPFWLFALYSAVRGMTRMPILPMSARPIAAFGAAYLLWSILFSPFAGVTRVLVPFIIVVLWSRSDPN